MRVTTKNSESGPQKTLTTVGGTPSGILLSTLYEQWPQINESQLMRQSFLKNKPLEPIHFKGKLVTS